MQNKFIFSSILTVFITSSTFAQTTPNVSPTADRNSIIGKTFPLVNAKTLLNNTIQFPAVAKGKICIAVVAFNDNSRSFTDAWVKQMPPKYTDSTIVFYEIPMIKNAPKLFRGVIEKGMRKGTDVKLHNNVANYYGSIKDYKSQLLMNNEDSCYVFVLDKDGKIQTSVEGGTTAENLKQIDDTIKGLSK